MTTIFIDDEPHYWPDGPPGAFVPLAEADALEAQIAALTTERDGLRDVLQSMLNIFDRGLPDGSIGRYACDEARDALNGPPNLNQNQLEQENNNEQSINHST